MRRVHAAALSLLVAGCAPVVSSSYATAPRLASSAEPVSISATRDPAGARELGVVEASGRRGTATLEALVAAFRARVSELGGDVGRIDSFRTQYELVTETYSYDCGTTETRMDTHTVSQPGAGGTTTFTTQTVPVTVHVPKTCTGTRKVEVATTALVGRAFRTRRGEP